MFWPFSIFPTSSSLEIEKKKKTVHSVMFCDLSYIDVINRNITILVIIVWIPKKFNIDFAAPFLLPSF